MYGCFPHVLHHETLKEGRVLVIDRIRPTGYAEKTPMDIRCL